MDSQTFGFMLYKDEVPNNLSGLEISGFSNYQYGQEETVNLKLPVLSSNIMFPNDFRSKIEISAATAISDLKRDNRFKVN